MVGRRCSDPAYGYFLPSLDYFLYEAELAAPLNVGGGAPPSGTDPPSSPLVRMKQGRTLAPGERARSWMGASQCSSVVCLQLNLGISPACEQYYRQQGYDFKLSNGRIVLVRRTPGSARRRRQEQVTCLCSR